jgi:hypothetical protein
MSTDAKVASSSSAGPDAANQPRLLSEARTLAAYLIFFGSYFVFALGKFPLKSLRGPNLEPLGPPN